MERQEEALKRMKDVQRGWAWDSECSPHWVALARQFSRQTGREGRQGQRSIVTMWVLASQSLFKKGHRAGEDIP